MIQGRLENISFYLLGGKIIAYQRNYYGESPVCNRHAFLAVEYTVYIYGTPYHKHTVGIHECMIFGVIRGRGLKKYRALIIIIITLFEK